MNKKNFKLEYDNYMKNIKPSTDLIQQTLKLAEEEQSRLQRSKEEKSVRLLCNFNFKRFSAIACTLVFALFAVKLWNDFDSQETIPVDPNPITDTTTTETLYIDVDTTTTYVDVDSDFNSTSLGGTTNINETTSNINETTSTMVSNDDETSESLSYVTSVVDGTSNVVDSESTSIVYNNENLYTTITEDEVSSIESTITTDISISNVTTTAVTTTAVSTTTSTTSSEIEEPDEPDTLLDEVFITTTIPEGGEYDVTTTITDETTIEVSNDVDSDDNTIGTTPFNSKLYIAIRVTLLDVQNGFYEDGTIYKDRLAEYLEYGNELMCIISLGTTENQDCDCIVVFDYDDIMSNYKKISYTILDDLNNQYYSKISNEDYTQCYEIKNLTEGLDLNHNYIGIETDLQDRYLLLDLLTIDDYPLNES
ncbi:MAG: hypothetical protein LIO71_04720 [Ruminococcus sp.]|nr:hypothetical protein [Ruminococcus sp.]